MFRIYYMHTLMEFKMFLREFISQFFTFLLPAVMFIFFGFMFQQKTFGAGGLSYFQAYIPAMIAIIIYTTAFFTVGFQIIMDREKGVYRRIMVTPVKPIVFLGSIITKGMFAVIGGAIEIILLGLFVFKKTPSSHLIQFFVALVFVSFSFFAIGFLIAALMKRSQAALALSIVTFYPMLFLSGATIPMEQLPRTLQATSEYIPLTHVVDLLQLAWRGVLFSPDAIFPAIFLTVQFFLCTAIGIRFFKWEA